MMILRDLDILSNRSFVWLCALVDCSVFVSVDGLSAAYVRAVGNGDGTWSCGSPSAEILEWVLWGACSLLIVANVVTLGRSWRHG